MGDKIKSILIEYILWFLIVGFMLWHVFITVIVLDPSGLVPISLIVATGTTLYLKHRYLSMAMQIWALYLGMSSAFKLVASYMQSVGSLTYEWSMLSLYRNIFFLVVAFFLFYVANWQIEESETH